MSVYTTQYDTDFANSQSAGVAFSNYDQFKQATVALYLKAGAVLADVGSTTLELVVAAQILNNPVQYARAWMGGFLADPTVQAGYSSPSDADMLAAADWIFGVIVL
jgi:hypothetical protein